MQGGHLCTLCAAANLQGQPVVFSRLSVIAAMLVFCCMVAVSCLSNTVAAAVLPDYAAVTDRALQLSLARRHGNVLGQYSLASPLPISKPLISMSSR